MTDSDTGVRQPAVALPAGRWGLSPLADVIYRTLVLLGPAGGARLSRELGVEPCRVDRAVEELADFGAIRLAEPSGGETCWAAREVDEVALIVRRRRAPIAHADSCRRHVAAVAGIHLDRIPQERIRVLPSRYHTRHRIADLAAGERVEHLSIHTEDVITAEAARVAGPIDQALIDRGVRMRVLGLAPRDGSVSRPPPGFEYREATSLPLKLMVFDRRVALFPLDPADFNAGAVEVSDPDAAAQLTQLFWRIWRTSHDPSSREVSAIVLTSREKAIVTLLAAGASEEATAAELGLSRRTVVYALRALMDRLGVENRFQLALVLGADGAVPIPRSGPVDIERGRER
ncbi:LuxR C-terminal-related transcriptional regulator [Actinoplanes sp. NPDC051861]|uniref:helix-turn-helix transcriptional regulator n=1 Tax=Actinoplanes sp. NPDC051861 TaxID=3155170 RepID=UPI003423DFBC